MKVKELLSSPEKWTKGKNARDVNGSQCTPTSTAAICWCLHGAVLHCYGTSLVSRARDAVEKKIFDRLGGKMMDYEWNDAPERSFEEVKALVEELEI